MKFNFIDDPHPMITTRPPLKVSEKNKGKESDEKDNLHFALFFDKYLWEVPSNVQLNLTHMYKSYDYHKMLVYFSTPTFCEVVKVKYILDVASLQKMRKRWITFKAPKERQEQG